MDINFDKVISGRVWKFGDSIETDAINPYYRYPTMDELKLHTMEAYRPEFPKGVKPGDVLVGGRNFGCGSRRPGLVLREVGIAAIIVESVSRLFLRNRIARAIPIFMAPGITQIVKDGDTLEVDYPKGEARNARTRTSIKMKKFPPLIEEIFRSGRLLEYAHARYKAESKAGKHPAPSAGQTA